MFTSWVIKYCQTQISIRKTNRRSKLDWDWFKYKYHSWFLRYDVICLKVGMIFGCNHFCRFIWQALWDINYTVTQLMYCFTFAVTFTRKRNHSNAATAAKVSVNHELWLSIGFFIWKNRLTSVQYALAALTSALTWKLICLRTLIWNHTSALPVVKSSDGIVTYVATP